MDPTTTTSHLPTHMHFVTHKYKPWRIESADSFFEYAAENTDGFILLTLAFVFFFIAGLWLAYAVPLKTLSFVTRILAAKEARGAQDVVSSTEKDGIELRGEMDGIELRGEMDGGIGMMGGGGRRLDGVEERRFISTPRKAKGAQQLIAQEL